MEWGRVVAGLLLVLAASATGHAAWANNWGSPMTFKLKPNGTIIADGDIEADTAQRLEAFLEKNNIRPDADLALNSRGGDLAAGLRMGEIIRAHHLHTWVSSDTKIAGLYKPAPGCGLFHLHRSPFPLACIDIGTYPGYCISACTFAFLGGVARDIWRGSIYAVHQAAMECSEPAVAQSAAAKPSKVSVPSCPSSKDAFSAAQVMAGTLVDYIQKMGADPRFLTEMAAADPSKVNPLSEAQMKKYKIIYTPGAVVWSMDSTPTGEFFLQETSTTEWKTNEVRFFCRRNPNPQLLIDVVYDPAGPGGSEDVQNIIASGRLGLKLSYSSPDWSSTHKWFDLFPGLALGPEEIIRWPFRNAVGKIELVLLATPRILDALRISTWFGVTNTLTGKQYVNFGGASPIDRTKFDEFAASCH